MSPFKETELEMKSIDFGNLMTQALMLFFGLLLLVPCAYKLTTYIDFRNHAIAVDGIIDKPLRGMEMGSKPKTHWFYAPEKGAKIKVF